MTTRLKKCGERVVEPLSADSFERSSPSSDVVVSASDPRRFPVDMSRPIPLVEPGSILGTFQIERRLARGGMSEVWLAQEQFSSHHVAIKILHDGVMQHSEDFDSVRAMFKRVHVLEHQHICPLQLLGHDSRFGFYIVMKYVEGVDLAVYRNRQLESVGEFPIKDGVRILTPVAQALDYAHGKGIAHCDVKPQNILVNQDDLAVQLVDFCLAAEIHCTAQGKRSSPIDHRGTRPYMSPEQWRGEPLDGRTDQYSLSVVAYELFMGRPPFQSDDSEALRRKVLNEAPPLFSGIGEYVNRALRRGLAKSRHDRFDTCTALVKALDGAIA